MRTLLFLVCLLHVLSVAPIQGEEVHNLSEKLSSPNPSLLRQEPVYVAVLELGAINLDRGDAQAMTERLRARMIEEPIFTVVERERMVTILEEQGFQYSGACTTEECVLQVGRILGVQKMVTGSVTRIGELYSLHLRLVDVETARVEQTVESDANSLEDLYQLGTGRIIRALAIAVQEGRTTTITLSTAHAGRYIHIHAGLGLAAFSRSSTLGSFVVIIGLPVG